MRKTRRPRRARRATAAPERTVDVITQLSTAARLPSAALLGALIGGAVPWFARTLAHDELPAAWAQNRGLALVMLVIVLGCAAFSMLTVYKFGLSAFGDRRKAVGFVAALEGVMLVSHGTTSAVALLILVAINAIANGCVIACARAATLRRQEADQRRSATRAQNRARTRGQDATTTATTATTPTPPAPTARRAPSPAGRVRAPRTPSVALAVRSRHPEVIEAEWLS